MTHVKSKTKHRSDDLHPPKIQSKDKDTSIKDLTGPVPAQTALDVQISGIVDAQTKDKYLLVDRADKTAKVSLDIYIISKAQCWQILADQGIVITDPATQRAVATGIEAVTDWPQTLYVAKLSGWHCGAYVLPGPKTLGEPTAELFHVQLKGAAFQPKQAGTVSVWKATAKEFVSGQSRLTLAVCASLATPIFDLIQGSQNVCIDSTGESTIGKTTGLLGLFASVWGPPINHAGSFALSLRTTAAGFEQHMLARAGTVFPADEANLLAGTTAGRASALHELAFMMAEGVERNRFGQPGEQAVPLTSWITTNRPLPSLLQNEDPLDLEAILVRFITVPADAGQGHGIFDFVPPGYTNSEAAIDSLAMRLKENYGYIAPKFIRRLVRERRRNEGALKERIAQLISDFLHRSGIPVDDRQGRRKAKVIATIYAAGTLAKEWGLLPIEHIGRSLLTCLSASRLASEGYTAGSTLSAIAIIRAHVTKNQNSIIDLSTQSLPEICNADLDQHPGFLRTCRGRQCILIRRSEINRLFGNDTGRLLDELDRTSLIITNTKFRQYQCRVRSNEAKDRMYAIALD